MHLLRIGCCLFVLGAVLWGGPASPTAAQDSRTLTIRNGTVYVDGQQLGADQVPDDLDLSGVSARYQFLGIQRPIIELNGRLYAVEDGLHPVSEDAVDAEDASVILQEVDAAAGPQTASLDTQAASTPQRQYLNDVQKANRELYERLVRERTLEQKAQAMAQSIRTDPDDSADREEQRDSLRTLLHNIFDLKQENRRLEVERLQREIQELERRLQKREEMREQMIDRRIDQLLGATHTP